MASDRRQEVINIAIVLAVFSVIHFAIVCPPATSTGGFFAPDEGKPDVAVCFHSRDFGAFSDAAAKNWSKFVMEPLDADVFAVGTGADGKAAAAHVMQAFGERVQNMLFESELSARIVESITPTFPGFRMYGNWSRSGNAFASNSLMELLWLQKCVDLVSAWEAIRGSRYDYLVLSQADYHWMAHAPPLDLLQQQQKQEGSALFMGCSSGANGGVASLVSAICPRDACNAYANLWDNLISGSFFSIVQKARIEKNADQCNVQRLHHAWLEANEVRIMCFPDVGHRRDSNGRWRIDTEGQLAARHAARKLSADGRSSSWDPRDFKQQPYMKTGINAGCIPSIEYDSSKAKNNKKYPRF